MAIMVRPRHVHAERICSRGLRDWLRLHGFSITEFVTRGLPVEMFEATGDHYGLLVAARARAEAAAEAGAAANG